MYYCVIIVSNVIKNTAMNKVKTIREQLPYGAIKRISAKTKTPYHTVNAVIDGKLNNKAVLLAAKGEIENYRKEQKEINDLRAELAQSA